MKLKEIIIRVVEEQDGEYFDTDFITTGSALPQEISDRCLNKMMTVLKEVKADIEQANDEGGSDE